MHPRSAVAARIRRSKEPTSVHAADGPPKRWADSASTKSLQFITIALTLVCVLVLPWMLGGVYDRAIALTGIVAGVALIAAVFHAVVVGKSIPGSAGIGLLLVAFALGAVQLIPLPVEWVNALSPESVSIRDTLSGVDPAANATLSIYPLATRADLARLWVAAAFVLIGFLSFYRSVALHWLLGLALLNGFCVAVFGIFQRILWNGRLFWVIPSPSTRSFGPFVNHNNAGGFLCLSVAFAAAMLFYRWAGNNAWAVDGNGREQRDSSRMQFTSVRVALAEMTDAGNLAMAIGISGILAGVLMSLSRGAALGAGAGIVGALCVMRIRGIRKQWLMLLILMVGAAFLVTWTRSADMIQARIASVFDERNMDSIRFLHWMDDVDMAKDYWLTGSGIGTYRFANRPYQNICDDGWFLYSENQYLESLLVGGIPGLLILLALLGVMIRAVVGLARAGGRENTTVAMLGGVVIASQMVAGFFDFGLYIPSNLVLFSLACGIVWRRYAELNNDSDSHQLTRHFVWSAFFIVLIGIVAVPELVKNANIEMVMGGTGRRIEVATDSLESMPTDIDARIGRMVSALAWQPDHVLGQAHLANLYMARCQRDIYSRLLSEVGEDTNPSQLWWYASPRYLSIRANEMRRQGDVVGLERLQATAEVKNDLTQALTHFAISRAVCPFVPRVHFRLAVLEPLVLSAASDTEAHLSRGTRVASIRPDVLQNAGAVALMTGLRPEGLEWFRKCVACEQGVSEQLLSLAIPLTSPSEFLESVAIVDPQELIRVADENLQGDELEPWRTEFALRAIKLGNQSTAEDGAGAQAVGDAYTILGKPLQAISAYEMAIEQDKSNVEYRFRLAVAYEDQSMLREAVREIGICVRMMPEKSKYERMLKRVQRKLQRKEASTIPGLN